MQIEQQYSREEPRASFQPSAQQQFAVDLLEAVDGISAIVFSMRVETADAKDAHRELRALLVELRRQSVAYMASSNATPDRIVDSTHSCKKLVDTILSLHLITAKPSNLPSQAKQVEQGCDSILSRIARSTDVAEAQHKGRSKP